MKDNQDDEERKVREEEDKKRKDEEGIYQVLSWDGGVTMLVKQLLPYGVSVLFALCSV